MPCRPLRAPVLLLLLAVSGCASYGRDEAYDIGAENGAEGGRRLAMLGCGRMKQSSYNESVQIAAMNARRYATYGDTFRQAYQSWFDEGRVVGELEYCRPPNTLTPAEQAYAASYSVRLSTLSDRSYLRDRARQDAENPASQARPAAAARSDGKSDFERAFEDNERRFQEDKQRELKRRVRRLEEDKHRLEQQARPSR